MLAAGKRAGAEARKTEAGAPAYVGPPMCPWEEFRDGIIREGDSDTSERVLEAVRRGPSTPPRCQARGDQNADQNQLASDNHSLGISRLALRLTKGRSLESSVAMPAPRPR